MKRVLFLEDDYPVARTTQRIVSQMIPDVQFEHLEYEKDLVEYLADHDEPEIQAVVLDVMVAYAPLKEKELEPVEVAREGYLRAGIRALEQIRHKPGYSNLPIILHSNVPTPAILAALKERNIDPNSVAIVSKGEDHEKLGGALKEALG